MIRLLKVLSIHNKQRTDFKRCLYALCLDESTKHTKDDITWRKIMSAQVDYLKVWHTPALSAMWMQWNWMSGGGKEEIKGLKKSVYSRWKLSEVMSLRKKTSQPVIQLMLWWCGGFCQSLWNYEKYHQILIWPQHYWSSVPVCWQRIEKKAANIQRKKFNVLQKVWRTVPEEYLEHYKKAYLSEFRLCWSLKLVTPSLDFQVH